MERLLTVDGAAELLHLRPRTARRMAAEGALPGKKVGRQWLFNPDHLVALVSEPDSVRVTPEDLREAGLSEKATDALWERLTAGRETV